MLEDEFLKKLMILKALNPMKKKPKNKTYTLSIFNHPVKNFL